MYPLFFFVGGVDVERVSPPFPSPLRRGEEEGPVVLFFFSFRERVD